MNKIYYFVIFLLIGLIILLSNSIFFGENNYSKRNDLVKENDSQLQKNDVLKKKNEILEFEIQNAQDSNDHIENFAREKLNLTYPEEEFINFKEDETEEDERK
tara:strand:+ start:434 stop:742 length:309 start_codon:yes stop_codon:yes gene_type:complete